MDFLSYWKKSQELTIIILIIGNILLVNVVFHYVMAATTNPGDTESLKVVYNAVGIW